MKISYENLMSKVCRVVIKIHSCSSPSFSSLLKKLKVHIYHFKITEPISITKSVSAEKPPSIKRLLFLTPNFFFLRYKFYYPVSMLLCDLSRCL